MSDDLKKKLEECEKKKEEYLAGWQRAKADFLNYKKEEKERTEETLKYAGEILSLNLLPILDNFDFAQKRLPENLRKDENVKGLLQIRKQILDFLRTQGVEEIKVKPGDKFNPHFQEAVETAEEKGADSEVILEEIKKGYTIHGKVLRPAKVKVAK
jgi:molecular chaperone GrpE